VQLVDQQKAGANKMGIETIVIVVVIVLVVMFVLGRVRA
jgi:hypothetical protein